MHQFAGTQDRIDRTGLDAERASDADLFVDDCDGTGFHNAAFRIQRFRLTIEQIGKCPDRRIPAGRTSVDVGTVTDDRRCIGATAGEAALCALGLGQQGVNAIYHRISFRPETDSGETQQQAESGRESGDGDNR
jgi:hypothetical protein